MDDEFDLPVEYKGDRQLFKTRLVVYGYSHRFIVNIFGDAIIFEPDEEKNYRAMINYEETGVVKHMDTELLKKIAGVIEGLVK